MRVGYWLMVFLKTIIEENFDETLVIYLVVKFGSKVCKLVKSYNYGTLTFIY